MARSPTSCMLPGTVVRHWKCCVGQVTSRIPVHPDLILLDLNMPRMDGRQFLARMKADDALMDIVVVILTTSVSDRDLVQTFDLHPDAYLNKPVDFDGLIQVVQSIWDFWFMVVRKNSADD